MKMGTFSDAAMVGFWFIIVFFVFFNNTNDSNSISELEGFCNQYGMNSTNTATLSSPFTVKTGCIANSIINQTYVTTNCEATQVNGTWYWKDAQCPVRAQDSGLSEPEFHQPIWRVR